MIVTIILFDMPNMSRISHKYKFIFFAYPKTGSSSVRKLLDPHSDIIAGTYKKRTEDNPFYSHITAAETKKIFEKKGWDYDSYFKFVVIRNPFSRIVSLYNMSSRKVPFRKYIGRLKNHGDGGCLEKDDKWKVHGAYSILNFAGDGTNLLVDQVVPLSQINHELPKLLQKLGLPNVPTSIPRHNIGRYGSKGRDWKTYYDADTKKKVAQLYHWELDKFGYSFK